MNDAISSLTFGSLFSGIGGMDLGFERAGLVCAWQVELAEFPRRVLAKHWPTTRRHDDVRTFPPTDPKEWHCDVICGGFPCKQTSTAAAIHGRRTGLAGTESGLWWEMLRVVQLVTPRFVVVENVGGSATYQAEITSGLEAAGYRLSGGPLRLSAQDVGARHLRRRLFWVAHRDEPRLAFTRKPDAPTIDGDSGRAANRDAWLSSLTRGMRVDDGVPARLDRRARITAIGNAVVPAVAERVARHLLRLNSLLRSHT